MDSNTTLADVVWEHAFNGLAALDALLYEQGNRPSAAGESVAAQLENIMTLTKPWPVGHPLHGVQPRLEPVSAGHDIPQMIAG